jgi:hypothetical protein
MTTAHRRPITTTSLISSVMVTTIAVCSAGLVAAPVLAQVLPTTIAPISNDAPAASLVTPDGQVLTDVPDQIVLTAIPPRLGDDGTLKAKPGEKIQTIVRIRNSSDKPLPVSTLVRDFIIGEDGKTPIEVSSDVSNRWSLSSWITLSPETHIIQPRQTVQVSVLISVPNDALPGGHYAMILHQPSQTTNDKTGAQQTDPQSVIAQRVGTLVYFTVDGPINEEAFVRNLQIPNLTEYGPVPFKFTVENVSDIHIKPSITVEVSNMLGQTVDTINLDQMNVFPYVSRDYQGQWDRVWGWGRYTAKVSMSYGAQGKVALASASFWLIPYTLIAAVGIGLIAVLTIILLIRRHLIHRRHSEQAKIQALETRLAQYEQSQTQVDQTPKTPTDYET